ncbi:MAG: hypothetical protein NT133_06705 [Alphaproteobacteria bacterium]|nr:hypothetical protein [Alphaproteobacteria bacterium]
MPAGEIETAVIDQARALLRQPDVVTATWRTARADAPDLTGAETREALKRLASLMRDLNPAGATVHRTAA